MKPILVAALVPALTLFAFFSFSENGSKTDRAFENAPEDTVCRSLQRVRQVHDSV
jgi:hypothetical protein